ncbi:MAG: type VI secretion system baseplate subunit TssF [Candidatus Cloacimonetes bacterium]|nr:type VI secretion system baseplate subunit TssF [Candidatus Cloacimonadota bacterium]
MNRFRDYFINERSSLGKRAEYFAEKYPDLAIQLKSGARDNDPDVERLLEGLAYLAANLQLKIDSEVPLLVNKLAELVFPQVTRVFPSMTIFKFTGTRNMKEEQKISRGSLIQSEKVDNTRCVYRTYEDVTVKPLEVRKFEYNEIEGKESIIIEIAGNIKNMSELKELEFYTNNIDVEADFLYLLKNFVKKVEFRCGTSIIEVKGEENIRTKLQYQKDNLEKEFQSGYHILQRFFVCPESFYMFIISGGDKLQFTENFEKLSIILHLDSSYKDEELSITRQKLKEISKENVLLNCVAGINIYEDKAVPINVEDLSKRHEVNMERNHQNIYKITNVEGSTKDGSREYQNWSEKRIDLENSYETIKYKDSKGRNRLYLQLESSKEEEQKEILHISLLCTDGELCKKLKKGRINTGSDNIPANVEVRNVTNPTYEYDPFIEEDEKFWKFICQYNFNIGSRLSVEDLRKLLEMYVPENKRSLGNKERQRLDSIEELMIKKERKLHCGFLEQGLVLSLRIKEEYVTEKGVGDIMLFGEVLRYFLEIVRPLNNYLRLEISSGKRDMIRSFD